MRFSMKLNDFQEAIQHLKHAGKGNNNVLIRVSPTKVNFIRFSNTGLIIRIKPSEVVRVGEVVVPLRYLLPLTKIKRDNSTLVSLTVVDNGDVIGISFDEYNINIPTESDIELRYWRKEHKPGPTSMVIDAPHLYNIISKVYDCIDPHDIRRSLTGMLMRTNANRDLIIAGTNGVKLSEVIGHHTGRRKGRNVDMIIKHGFLKTVRALLKQCKGKVSVSIKDNQIAFKFGNITVIDNLILGEDYPNYNTLFENNWTTSIKMRLDELSRIVKEIEPTCDPEDNYRMTIAKIDDHNLSFGSDIMTGHHFINDSIVGDIDIDINGVFFSQLLNEMDSETVEINWREGLNYITMNMANNQKALLTSLLRR